MNFQCKISVYELLDSLRSRSASAAATAAAAAAVFCAFDSVFDAFCAAFCAAFCMSDAASKRQDELDGIDDAPRGAITFRSGLA